jgi:hypothetical protein
MLRIFGVEGADLDIPNKVCNASKLDSLLKVKAGFPQHPGPNSLAFALRLALRLR